MQAASNVPVLLALDRPSGSGKSLLASLVVHEIGAVLIQADDFYAADVPDTLWDARAPSERARDALNWRRMRSEAVLSPMGGLTHST